MAHPSLASQNHHPSHHALPSPHHQAFGQHHAFVAASASAPCLTATVAKHLQMIESSSSVNQLNNHSHNNHPTGTWLHPHPRVAAMPPAALGQHHPFRSSGLTGHHPLSSSHVRHQVAALHAIHALHDSLMFPAVPSDTLPSSSSMSSSQSSPTTSSTTSSSTESISPSYSSSTMISDNNAGLVLYSPCLDAASSSNCSANNFLDVHKGKAIRLRVKVLVPVQDHPNVRIDSLRTAVMLRDHHDHDIVISDDHDRPDVGPSSFQYSFSHHLHHFPSSVLCLLVFFLPHHQTFCSFSSNLDAKEAEAVTLLFLQGMSFTVCSVVSSEGKEQL